MSARRLCSWPTSLLPDQASARKRWLGATAVIMAGVIAGRKFGTRRTASPPTRRDVLLEPREDLAVPVAAVLRLEHPVALVGEIDHARRDAEALQGREQLDALADRDAVVAVVVDDEHRRLEV